jgi:hypothetical protein
MENEEARKSLRLQTTRIVAKDSIELTSDQWQRATISVMSSP